jgi:hypothetical protein
MKRARALVTRPGVACIACPISAKLQAAARESRELFLDSLDAEVMIISICARHCEAEFGSRSMPMMRNRAGAETLFGAVLSPKRRSVR